jgi:hypothetical protein
VRGSPAAARQPITTTNGGSVTVPQPENFGCFVVPATAGGVECYEAAAVHRVPICRFIDKIEIDFESGCWLWTGRVDSQGYGEFSYLAAKRRAHRVGWLLFVGSLQPREELDHLCRVRRCVNPDHLEPVLCRENLLRGRTLAAANVAKTHCPQGHPYDEGNTIRKRGARVCRECNRLGCERRNRARRTQASA